MPRPSGYQKVEVTNPEENAWWINRWTFWYLNKILVLGYKEPLCEEHLWPLEKGDQSSTVSKKFEQKWNEEMDKESPSLFRALQSCFGWHFYGAALYKIVNDTGQFIGPMVIAGLVSFMTDVKQPLWRGLLYIAAMFLGPNIVLIAINLYFHRLYRCGMHVRAAIVTAVYRKSLRLSSAARQEHTTGEIVNLMSTDAKRLQSFLIYAHNIWSSPVQIIISVTLLFMLLGWTVVAGVALMVLLVPINILNGRIQAGFEERLLKKKDERIKLMNESLQGMRVIKFFAWETPFMERINVVRRLEIKALRGYANLDAFGSFLWSSTPVMVTVATFALHSAMGYELTMDKLFPALALFRMMQFPLSALPWMISSFVAARVSLGRLEEFLLGQELQRFEEDKHRANKKSKRKKKKKRSKKGNEEIEMGLLKEASPSDYDDEDTGVASGTIKMDIDDDEIGVAGDEGDDDLDEYASSGARRADDGYSACPEGTAVWMHGGTYMWDGRKGGDAQDGESASLSSVVEDQGSYTLSGVTVNVKKGSLVVVIGKVGAGKSSFLSALLGEMQRVSGQCGVKGSIAYVPQTAWIKNSTLRENIIFGKEEDEEKYLGVVRDCAMEPDVKQLQGGHNTEIGEKGINLSGGQKQRISLARAVYRDADIYLLDDPLSAVDVHVGTYLYEECIKKRLADKTVILVTHQLYTLQSADTIIYMHNGAVEAVGTFSELISSGLDLMELVEFEEEDEDEENNVVEEATSLGRSRSRSGGRSGLRQSKSGGEGDWRKISFEDVAEEEERGLGMSISGDDGDAVRRERSASDGIARKVSFEGGDEEALSGDEEEDKDNGSLIQDERRETGSVKASVYKSYFLAAGYIIVGFLILFGAGIASGKIVTDYWLSNWASQDDMQDGKHFWYYFGGYLGLACVAMAFTGLETFGIANVGVNTAAHMHNKTLMSVFRAPISFFDATPVGRILNRFSKDLDSVESIPKVMQSFMNCAFSVISVLVLMGVSSPVLLLGVPPLAIMYYLVQRYYIATNRELKRLDSISNSPIYSHFAETLNGLSSIRAYGVVEAFARANEAKLDNNHMAYFIAMGCNRWLSQRLQFLGNCIVCSAALVAVTMRTSLDPLLVGLSLTYALSVTGTLNWWVRMTTELETQMNAVERMDHYSDIDQEAPSNIAGSTPSRAWPARGRIQFEGLSLRYRVDLEPVLKDISCDIRPREKIGICGRTGAGKSSLMLALFRLVEPCAGRIVIDGVDIATVGLDQLRQSMSIIPQDPILFSGTVRKNLDPFDSYSDSAMWGVLDRVHLREAIKALPEGLESAVTENGDNFSVGQRQLLCLGRALLRRAKVIVLDEATAAVDMETDDLIQETLRTECKDSTVLTIAHRLNTIIDYDRLMVLDKGCLVEMGTPLELLTAQVHENDELSPSGALVRGVFASMVQNAGEAASAALLAAARRNWENKNGGGDDSNNNNNNNNSNNNNDGDKNGQMTGSDSDEATSIIDLS
eukprot:TRINITY_DN1574_c0_g1_i1.p1 TRINITY_DN1574_c0_g1~~TRINITY_DN1574_c0_g1_i1.p1  ORF type:complete len:1537 (+),score=433.37 TRINITY_DN1574_c0_g1_i1:133-4611(+)